MKPFLFWLPLDIRIMSITIYHGFRLVFGTLYPAYASYKAVKTKNVKEYVSIILSPPFVKLHMVRCFSRTKFVSTSACFAPQVTAGLNSSKIFISVLYECQEHGSQRSRGQGHKGQGQIRCLNKKRGVTSTASCFIKS